MSADLCQLIYVHENILTFPMADANLSVAIDARDTRSRDEKFDKRKANAELVVRISLKEARRAFALGYTISRGKHRFRSVFVCLSPTTYTQG